MTTATLSAPRPTAPELDIDPYAPAHLLDPYPMRWGWATTAARTCWSTAT